jgi:hypothetical protein
MLNRTFHGNAFGFVEGLTETSVDERINANIVEVIEYLIKGQTEYNRETIA